MPVRVSQANDQPMQVDGEHRLDIVIQELLREFTPTFIVSDSVYHLLGHGFLVHFKIMVHCHNNCIHDTTTPLRTLATVSGEQPTILVVNDLSNLPPHVRSLLSQHPSLLLPQSNVCLQYRCDTQ